MQVSRWEEFPEAKVASKRDKMSSRETIRSSLFVRKNDFSSTYLFALPANTAVFFFAPRRLGRFARETSQAAKSKERRLYSQATFCAYSLSLHQVMQVRVPNMLTNARCVPREVSCSAVTPVHWLIISTVCTHHWGEYRAGTGPVRSALGPMTKGRGAVVLKKLP